MLYKLYNYCLMWYNVTGCDRMKTVIRQSDSVVIITDIWGSVSDVG